MVDLNDRDYADQTVRTPFFPRADAYYKIQPITFEEYESESRAGWRLTVEVLEGEEGKTDPLFEPIAGPGRQYEVRFNRIDPTSFKVKDMLFELRQFLAACMGEEHTPEFDANGPLSQLVEMGDLSALDPILLHVDAYKSKPKADGENAGKVFVNTRNVFQPIAA